MTVSAARAGSATASSEAIAKPSATAERPLLTCASSVSGDLVPWSQSEKPASMAFTPAGSRSIFLARVLRQGRRPSIEHDSAEHKLPLRSPSRPFVLADMLERGR